jgi:uncharacterized protein YjiS (DUF1127 family)
MVRILFAAGPVLALSDRNRASDRFARILTAMLDLPAQWAERARQRRELAELSDRQLADVGLSRSLVAFEVAKPVWRR